MNIRIALLGSRAATPAETAAVLPVADQSQLVPVTLGLTASATPTAYAWTVNGSTAGLDDPTVAAPVFSPLWPGSYTVHCTATIGGQAIEATPQTFLVGDGSCLLVGPPAIPDPITP